MRNPLLPPYSRYAAVYDSIGQTYTGSALARESLQLLAEHRAQPRKALDLACGTGAATFTLHEAGLAVTAADRSAAMLQVARRHAAASGIRWLLADLRRLPFQPAFDLVTCFYDAVNYLLETSELRAFLRGAARLLLPGGWLVFDLNTRRRMAEGWSDGCIVAADRPDLFGIYRSWFDEQTDCSPLMLTFFERTESGWQRFDEEHIERVYNVVDVKVEIASAGFELIECRAFDDRRGLLLGPGSEQSYRVVFCARLPADMERTNR